MKKEKWYFWCKANIRKLKAIGTRVTTKSIIMEIDKGGLYADIKSILASKGKCY